MKAPLSLPHCPVLCLVRLQNCVGGSKCLFGPVCFLTSWGREGSLTCVCTPAQAEPPAGREPPQPFMVHPPSGLHSCIPMAGTCPWSLRLLQRLLLKSHCPLLVPERPHSHLTPLLTTPLPFVFLALVPPTHSGLSHPTGAMLWHFSDLELPSCPSHPGTLEDLTPSWFWGTLRLLPIDCHSHSCSPTHPPVLPSASD